MQTMMGSIWMREVQSSILPLIKPSLSASLTLTSTVSSFFIPSSNSPLIYSIRSFLLYATSSSCSAAPLASIDHVDVGSFDPAPTRVRKLNLKKDSKVLLKGMRYAELEKWAQSHGYRPGQAIMLWKLLYGDNIWASCVDELEGLNKVFKKLLSQNAEFKVLSLKEICTAIDGTRKILFTLEDGLVIETVVIPSDGGRNTVCVSSQAGCAMNCQFCYTGRMGLRRHLTAAEIVEQAVFARRLFSSEVGPITNVVFMGMGEPLHNVENVIKAADIMVHEQGLHFSPRKVTVSTSGLVPQLKCFLRESTCALAVSLNATTDEVRNWIMPINRKYNLQLLLDTLQGELRFKHKYKVLFEYVMLAGVNDSDEDAKRLIDLVQGIPCKINLIPFNPHCGSQFRPTREERMIEFRNFLAEGGCAVFLRPSRGEDQMAACGQLGKPGKIQAPLLRVPAQFQMAMNA